MNDMRSEYIDYGLVVVKRLQSKNRHPKLNAGYGHVN